MRRNRVTLYGRYHRIENAVVVPPPARRIPVLMAGNGSRLQLKGRWTLRYATELSAALSDAPEQAETVDATGVDRFYGIRPVAHNVATTENGIVSREFCSLDACVKRFDVGVDVTQDEKAHGVS